ncbi:nickel pincer cofactor biosynthesis protein LarB [Phycisphaera mikurensis]|uniref:Putative phosphoribosylaminoimidazole carboxylase n=1 Tax=Phycisphaera mikurensis (strain NBRC 102666 / KCTC 22515 / FYK2301M01) TaxID=1142394 RepID=I0IFR1_PHYMF|nr:nickel pincer cofactor biosynthesis protein LarB [Phycisphaera mikurensis]MBB6440511.1 hypothetical protein [Phycisphaera mikurensis]BAM04099.1 putative phosphoribosylaminoimidazole carboxylase [Phycisphaera mikurensis NBRC 102666]
MKPTEPASDDDGSGDLHALLGDVAAGRLSPAAAAARLGRPAPAEPPERLGFATVDHDRGRRCGLPEVVYAEHKTPEEVIAIVDALRERSGYALATRVKEADRPALRAAWSGVPVQEAAGAGAFLVGSPPPLVGLPPVPVVAAGTSDLPVAREAELTLRAMGQSAHRITDVGVAGLHRLLERLPELAAGRVVVVIAGMEGALPSVVAGLLPAPVVAVPTSVGYGAAFGGVAALLGMLNSCGSGVTVVNIDNGFGAALSAGRINALGGPAEPDAAAAVSPASGR